MAMTLRNAPAYVVHGYAQFSPAHHAHQRWSLAELRQTAQTARKGLSSAASPQQRAHVAGLEGAVRLRKLARTYLTGPIDFVLGTGRFRPQPRPIYEDPNRLVQNTLAHPSDSGLVGALAWALAASKVASCAALGCLVGGLVGACMPRATLAGGAVRGLGLGAQWGVLLAAAAALPPLWALTGARLASAGLKAGLAGAGYAAAYLPALVRQADVAVAATPVAG